MHSYLIKFIEFIRFHYNSFYWIILLDGQWRHTTWAKAFPVVSAFQCSILRIHLFWIRFQSLKCKSKRNKVSKFWGRELNYAEQRMILQMEIEENNRMESSLMEIFKWKSHEIDIGHVQTCIFVLIGPFPSNYNRKQMHPGVFNGKTLFLSHFKWRSGTEYINESLAIIWYLQYLHSATISVLMTLSNFENVVCFAKFIHLFLRFIGCNAVNFSVQSFQQSSQNSRLLTLNSEKKEISTRLLHNELEYESQWYFLHHRFISQQYLLELSILSLN